MPDDDRYSVDDLQEEKVHTYIHTYIEELVFVCKMQKSAQCHIHVDRVERIRTKSRNLPLQFVSSRQISSALPPELSSWMKSGVHMS